MVGQDADLARWLRKHCIAPVLLAANKAERRGASGLSGVQTALTDATRLGFGDPVAISAESGQCSSCCCVCTGCTVGVGVSVIWEYIFIGDVCGAPQGKGGGGGGGRRLIVARGF